MERDNSNRHLRIAYLNPRSEMCNQVSRLYFILLGRLPIFTTVAFCRFVRFTGTGLVRKSHPRSHDAYQAPHSHADTHAIHLCLYYTPTNTFRQRENIIGFLQ